MPQTSVQERLAATVSGAGDRVIVLANGLGTSQATWAQVEPSLAARARVVRFDYPGMGAARAADFDPDAYATLYGYADDLVALLEELDVRDALLVGHSVSGMIGGIAAAAAPDRIARLVMIGASPRYVDDGDYRGGFSRDAVEGLLQAAAADFSAWATGFAPLAVGPDATPDGIAHFASYLRMMRPDIALHVLRTVFLGDYREVLPRITQPVTVVQALEDVAVPMAVAEYLAARLPHAHLTLLQARGHVPHLTAAPAVEEALRYVVDGWRQ